MACARRWAGGGGEWQGASKGSDLIAQLEWPPSNGMAGWVLLVGGTGWQWQNRRTPCPTPGPCRSAIPVVTCVLVMLVENKMPTRREAASLGILSLGVMMAVWQVRLRAWPAAGRHSLGNCAAPRWRSHPWLQKDASRKTIATPSTDPGP